jgi:hypothetical protein
MPTPITRPSVTETGASTIPLLINRVLDLQYWVSAESKARGTIAVGFCKFQTRGHCPVIILAMMMMVPVVFNVADDDADVRIKPESRRFAVIDSD